MSPVLLDPSYNRRKHFGQLGCVNFLPQTWERWWRFERLLATAPEPNHSAHCLIESWDSGPVLVGSSNVRDSTSHLRRGDRCKRMDGDRKDGCAILRIDRSVGGRSMGRCHPSILYDARLSMSSKGAIYTTSEDKSLCTKSWSNVFESRAFIGESFRIHPSLRLTN